MFAIKIHKTHLYFDQRMLEVLLLLGQNRDTYILLVMAQANAVLLGSSDRYMA